MSKQSSTERRGGGDCTDIIIEQMAEWWRSSRLEQCRCQTMESVIICNNYEHFCDRIVESGKWHSIPDRNQLLRAEDNRGLRVLKECKYVTYNSWIIKGSSVASCCLGICTIWNVICYRLYLHHNRELKNHNIVNYCNFNKSNIFKVSSHLNDKAKITQSLTDIHLNSLKYN